MIEFVPNTLGLKILGRDGKYSDFAGIAYMGDVATCHVDFSNGKSLTASRNHRLMTPEGRIAINDIEIGTQVYRKDGRKTRVTMIRDSGETEPVYDIIEVRDGHQYVANGIMNSNCKFVTDEETLIDPLCLQRLESIEPAFYTNQVRWYVEPIPNRAYLVALDPCLGTGRDYAAIQVFVLPELIQVAEWQHNKTDIRGQVRVLLQILYTLQGDLMDHPEQQGEPDIYWTVENNSMGEAIIAVIEDTGLEKFPGTIVNERKKRGRVKKHRKGLTTTVPSKLSSCARFKSLIESDRMTINSRQTLIELKGFIARGKSYAAKSGEHDDLVSACLLITRMLDIVLQMGEDIPDLKETIADDEIWAEAMPVVV